MTSFVDPFQDPLGEGYQAVQSLLALGSGGLFGVGSWKKRAEKPVSAGTAERLYPGDRRRRTRVYRQIVLVLARCTAVFRGVASMWRSMLRTSSACSWLPGRRADGWNTSYFKYCGRNIFHAAVQGNQPAIYKLWRKRTPQMFMFSAGVLLNISRHAPKNTGVE